MGRFIIVAKKLTYEFVKESFEKEGYELLSKEYISAHHKLKYRCPEGYEHTITWAMWQQGQRYPYRGEANKITIEIIKKSMIKENYKLLTTNYINRDQKLDCICPHKNIYRTTWAYWKNGRRCSCSTKYRNRYSIDDVKEVFNKKGYKLLSTEYKGNKQKLDYICDKGHSGKVSFSNLLKGVGCPQCANNVKKDINYVRENIEYNDYKLISDEYVNSKIKLHLVCPNGHDYYVSWDNWNSKNNRCPKCNLVGTSKQELELIEFAKNLGFEILERDRSLIAPYELDIVIPAKKIAIEYCGLYWHSEIAGKDRNYHLSKLKACEEKGYRLITIFEDELLYNKEVVFSRLKNILGSDNLETIYARKCNIKPVDIKEVKQFCEQNHLQGYHGSNIKLGAFHDNELVSVMAFSEPSIAKGARNYQNNVWELSRFCSKINYHVVGIASKLLKYFERNYSWNEIFSYADRRWSNGNLYEKLGFDFVKETQPNYWYLKGQNRIHRFALRKTKEDPKNIIEWEIRKSQGYNRIWDCGNLKYMKMYSN